MTHPPEVEDAARMLASAFPASSRAHLEDALRGGSWKEIRAAVSSARTLGAAGTPLLLPLLETATRSVDRPLDNYAGYGAREVFLGAQDLIDACERLSRGTDATRGTALALLDYVRPAFVDAALQTLRSGTLLAIRGALRVLEKAAVSDEIRIALDAYMHASAGQEGSEAEATRSSALRLLARMETPPALGTRAPDLAPHPAAAPADGAPQEDTAPLVAPAERRAPEQTDARSATPSLAARIERELRSGSPATRRAALDVLQQRRDLAALMPDAIGAIVDAPRDGTDAAELMRGRALAILARLEPSAAERTHPWYAQELNSRFLDLAERDEHPQVRASALKALSNKTADTEALREACVAALEDEHPQVRATAAELLAMLLQRAGRSQE